jgi:hypothetical protein
MLNLKGEQKMGLYNNTTTNFFAHAEGQLTANNRGLEIESDNLLDQLREV